MSATTVKTLLFPSHCGAICALAMDAVQKANSGKSPKSSGAAICATTWPTPSGPTAIVFVQSNATARC